MSRVLEPTAVLVGATLVSYCLWQLVFDPFGGPLPGRVLPVVVLGLGFVVGLGMLTWGYYRLGLLRRP